MAVDTPARIAVLGAGPIGLEAALYARFLGYDVVVYERGEVADHVRAWGHVRMFSPIGMNSSSLGRAALAAQDPVYRSPDPTALLTGAEWVESYLQPLARSDLLDGQVHTRSTVLAVGKSGLLKGDFPGRSERGDEDFLILWRDVQGQERVDTADVVIDATGVLGQPNWLGQGGIPAPGEEALRHVVRYDLPDILGRQRDHYAGRHTLVVGGGYTAATHVVALAELSRQAPGTRATWITRRRRAEDGSGPLPVRSNDPLPERHRLATAANQLAADPRGPIRHFPQTHVAALAPDGSSGRVTVQFAGLRQDSEIVDSVLANVGFRPDLSLCRELQVQLCYASEGPLRLAANLLAAEASDCLAAPATGVESLLQPEPHFYVLGAKSYGRNPHFLFAAGLRQIRDVFSIIGDRADLDLYAGAEKLPL